MYNCSHLLAVFAFNKSLVIVIVIVIVINMMIRSELRYKIAEFMATNSLLHLSIQDTKLYLNSVR